MSEKTHPIFKKLDRIPAAPNFVRYNFDDLPRMIKAYVQFAKAMPSVSYQAGITLIKDLVLGHSDVAQALKAAARLPASPSKEAVIGFVDAFCAYAATRDYQATPAYSDFATWFPIARELSIPVKPTLIAREGGQLKPIFVYGWKSIPLDRFQRRLLMTILEDAIFSLTDFEASDAEIVFLPEIDGVRSPEVWHRGDYDLLSQSEMNNQIELFLTAREAAYPIIQSWVASKSPAQPSSAPTGDGAQISLSLEAPQPRPED
jgi:hypothetical protein